MQYMVQTTTRHRYIDLDYNVYFEQELLEAQGRHRLPHRLHIAE
jgi:hypothetical protein